MQVLLEGQVGGAVSLVVEVVLAGLPHLSGGAEPARRVALEGGAQDVHDAVGNVGVELARRRMMPGHDLLQHLAGRLAVEEAAQGEHLEQHRPQAEQVAAVVRPHLQHHLRRHVCGLAGEGAVLGPGAGGNAEIDQLHRALARHHDVARAHVAVHDGRLLEHVLQGAADAAGNEHRQLHVGLADEGPVPLEVFDEAPAVDVLEDDAHLAVHPVEIEDAADVFVVEHRVPAGLVDEELQVGGILGVAQLLHDDRTLEARLSDEQALVDLAHPADAELLEHRVLGHAEGGNYTRPPHALPRPGRG